MKKQAQKNVYNILATAKSVAEISSLEVATGARRLFLSGFFLRETVPFYGQTANGVEKLAETLLPRYC